MKYWIASCNQDNWAIMKRKNIWGIPKRNKNTYERVSSGDHLIVFVRQEVRDDTLIPSMIPGAFKIDKSYEDESSLFSVPPQMTDEKFPYRFKLKPLSLFNPEIEFKPLIETLSFIKNKTMWSGHLRAAMREIPKEDYNYILQIGKEKR